MNVIAVIPSRFTSSRFPGKPLVLIEGKTMIQRVYEQASRVPSLREVVVATDDQRIFEHVQSFGGKVEMTDPKHLSGTDRCAEIAAGFPEADYIINIQGDEPFLQVEQIETLIEVLKNKGKGAIATLVKKIENEAELFDPSVVKAVISRQQKALYFSRNVIPHCRGTDRADYLKTTFFYKHLGLYGFDRNTLLEIAELAPSDLEKAESLEQLRWLENGYSIYVGLTELETMGIDTPEDLERAVDWLKGRG